jgi:endonuclease
MQEMVPALGLTPGQVFTKDDAVAWFAAHYPLVKEGTIAAHLIRLSTNNKNRLHYSARADGSDDLFFQIDPPRFRLYDVASDPAPIRDPSQAGPAEPSSPESPTASSEFAYEHDLRDYLSKNLTLIEAGLRLYSEESISGVEFPAGGRFIDILALDSSGGYVVIELKVSRGYDRVVGQLLRYMGWIQKHHADPNQRVRGIIVAKDVTDDLRLACSTISDVLLFEYSLSVSLKPVAL